MRAILSRTAGGPDTLELCEVSSPQPGPEEVVVEVKAVGVNYPDLLMIQDLYQEKPKRPFTPGREIAGIVRSVGPGVTRFTPGDRVLAVPRVGGMAEQVAVDESTCVAIPPSMPFEEAACLVTTYGTAHYALKWRAQLREGETLLVLGAAGGVGLAAVEIGRALGAHVVAAASSEEKVGLAKLCGAQDGIVYPSGSLDAADRKMLSSALKAACGGGADVVCDAVGGDYAEPALRTLRWDGRYLVVGFPAGIPKMPLNLVLLKSCQIVGVALDPWLTRGPGTFQAHTNELLRLYEEGHVRPRISRSFPLERAADAVREIAERRAMGKVVIAV